MISTAFLSICQGNTNQQIQLMPNESTGLALLLARGWAAPSCWIRIFSGHSPEDLQVHSGGSTFAQKLRALEVVS